MSAHLPFPPVWKALTENGVSAALVTQAIDKTSNFPHAEYRSFVNGARNPASIRGGNIGNLRIWGR